MGAPVQNPNDGTTLGTWYHGGRKPVEVFTGVSEVPGPFQTSGVSLPSQTMSEPFDGRLVGVVGSYICAAWIRDAPLEMSEVPVMLVYTVAPAMA